MSTSRAALAVLLVLSGCGHPRGPASPAASTSPVAPVVAAPAIELRPGGTLAAALGRARAGDRVIVRAGKYPREKVQAVFSDFVTIEAAAGETVTFSGLAFLRSQHIKLRGLRFDATLLIEESSHFDLAGLDIDAGQTGEAALHLLTRKPDRATAHIRVARSRIRGGGRTVFVLTHFRPSAGWNGPLTFVDNEFHCGSRCCFQLSGARDTVIADNRIVESRSKGILLAGATRIQILRNHMKDGSGPAVHIGTPGAAWDPFAGVEHMISSDVLVEGNVIRNWQGPAVQLDGSRQIEIRGNTVENAAGLVTHRREPKDLAGNVILTGNTAVRLRGNRMPDMVVADGDPPPLVEP